MRSILILVGSGALVAAGSAHANPPVPLQPIGLPFAPESPKALEPNHPLYHRVAIDPIAEMPEKFGFFLAPITSAKEMNEALRQTLERSNMLAPPGVQPKARLTVRWIGMDVPRKISSSSEATASLGYSLVRIDNGQEIFRRDISTHSRSRGGDATDRMKGNARLALVTNLASLVVCLDKAAYGKAPADCALTSQATYRAIQPATVTFVPRR